MAYYVCNHIVEDFDNWKKVYDQFGRVHEKFNVTENIVLQSKDKPTHVMVIGEGTMEDIEIFLNSEDIKKGMAAAGVAGPPVMFIGENRK